MSRQGFAYMVRCADGSYYVGSTDNLDRRLWEHNEGLGATYTRRRRPVVLVWSEQYTRIDDAYLREKQVQGWSRAKREALVRGDYEALPGLSTSTKALRRGLIEQCGGSDAPGTTKPPRSAAD